MFKYSHFNSDSDSFSKLFERVRECQGTCFIDGLVFGSDLYFDEIRPALEAFNAESKQPVKLMVHAADVYKVIRKSVPEGGKKDRSGMITKVPQIMEDIGNGGCLYTFGEMGNCRSRKETFLDRVFRESFKRTVFVITNNSELADDLGLIGSFDSCSKNHAVNVVPVSGCQGSTADISRFRMPSGDASILNSISDKDTMVLVDTNFFAHEKFMETVYSTINRRNSDSGDRLTVTLHQSNILELVKIGYNKPDLSDRIDKLLQTINRDLHEHRNFRYGEGMAAVFLDGDILSTVLLNMRSRNIVVFTQDRGLVNDIVRLNHLKSVRPSGTVLAMGFNVMTNELGSMNYRECYTPGADRNYRSPSPEAAA